MVTLRCQERQVFCCGRSQLVVAASEWFDLYYEPNNSGKVYNWSRRVRPACGHEKIVTARSFHNSSGHQCSTYEIPNM